METRRTLPTNDRSWKAWRAWADYLHSTDDTPTPPSPKPDERWPGVSQEFLPGRACPRSTTRHPEGYWALLSGQKRHDRFALGWTRRAPYADPFL